MFASIRQSISRKIMLVVMATTFLALLSSSLALLVYDARTYKADWTKDLMTQADLLGRVSVPALHFNHATAAGDNLAVLKSRSRILQAAIYSADGRLFATYLQPGIAELDFPPQAQTPGAQIAGDRIMISHPVFDNGTLVGSVYLQARYELGERTRNYLEILAAMIAGSMLIAAIISFWLQSAVTKPIHAITDVARDFMQRRDFSLRVKKNTEDEIGVLVDAFNGMLDEVVRRTLALEQSNRTLQHEMGERRAAEEALLAADRRKDEFLATLAHELRNPLAPISNGLAILRMAGADEASALQAREIMERQLRQMVRLIDDLIDVSRISTGKLSIRKSRVELQTVIDNAVEVVNPLISARAHTLGFDVPKTPIYVDADATRLAQVFSNLLNNAAKYTNVGGRIVLAVHIDGQQVVVTVTDNGIGIPASMQTQIFDMFAQVDQTLERTQAGLGVGLSLAKRLVELHGGSIEAASLGRGAGSIFTVRLPLAGNQDTGGAELGSNGDDSAPARHRILLADDNADYATTLATLLQAMGHEVQVTHDGEAALAAAASFNPDFAFLDIGMPKLNGYQLAASLREQPATRHCTLVAITGWGQEKDRQRALQAGFDFHIVKPAELEKVRSILARKRI